MRSVAMRQLDRIVRTIAGKDVVVTFIGESGTGKEILARRLHELSHRHAGPFIPINCAAIPDTLFETELFAQENRRFVNGRSIDADLENRKELHYVRELLPHIPSFSVSDCQPSDRGL